MPAKTLKQQAALEYLTTYGWMMLIVVIIFVLLIQLGIFNIGQSYTANPGSCSVYRPYGTNTVTGVTLQGICNNLIPKFVAYFNGHRTSNIVVPAVPALYTYPETTGLTVSLWVDFKVVPPSSVSLIGTYPATNPPCGYRLQIYTITTTQYDFGPSCANGATASFNLQPNVWYNIVATIGTGSTPTETYYVNGAQISSGGTTGWSNGNTWNSLYLGSYPSFSPLNGYLSNIQVYDSGFSQSEVTALYAEGIGGAPIGLPWLMAWWPLNGNANDYAGNNDTSASNAVTYTTQWMNGYTPP